MEVTEMVIIVNFERNPLGTPLGAPTPTFNQAETKVDVWRKI